FRCRFETPVLTRWRDQTIATCGQWSQGPALAQCLLMLDHLGLDGLACDDPDYLHLLAEVVKFAFADREHHYGDPAFVPDVPPRLLSGDHIARRCAQISREVATTDLPAPLFGCAAPMPVAQEPYRRDGDTSYLCVMDCWGNAFSATPSDASW